MKETLIYIGRWFIRFILIAIIFSTFQSCAKAAQITTALLNDVNEKANKVFDYYGYDYENKFTNGILYSPNIPKMCIGITASNSPYKPNYLFVFFPDQEPMTLSSNKYTTWAYQIVNLSNGNREQPSGYSIPKTTIWNYIYTEFNWSSTTGYDFQANNEYGAEIILRPPFTYYLGSLHTKEITYNDETVLANTLNYNYRISWVANVVCEDTIITSMQAYLDDFELECYDLGTYWNLEYPNSTMFKYNQLYNLRVESIIDGNIETLEAKILFVPPGTTISSGVITSIPSGDFSFNTENATNQIIDNQNENQEDNQSFLDNLYNQMFTVSGEQVQQIVNTTMENIQIPSGEIAEIEQIFNYLSGDAGDFVISWTDKTTHFTVNGANIHQLTIPARQINFSEMERQSPELQQAMHWARLITNISIFSILIHEAYICLLATLGVPVAIYGQKLEEKQQLAAQQQKQEQAWQNRLEQQRYNEWLYSHRKR